MVSLIMTNNQARLLFDILTYPGDWSEDLDPLCKEIQKQLKKTNKKIAKKKKKFSTCY